MKVELTSDPAEFRDHVFDDLRADPVLNTVMLVAVASWAGGKLSDPRPPTFARLLDDDGRLLAAAMRTPPYQVGLLPRTSPEHAVAGADRARVDRLPALPAAPARRADRACRGRLRAAGRRGRPGPGAGLVRHGRQHPRRAGHT